VISPLEGVPVPIKVFKMILEAGKKYGKI